jgi:protein O-mannosyl-transferase
VSSASAVQISALAALLIVAGVSAYLTSFRGVFVLDDVRAIVQNTSITSFAGALTPPGACTVAGRPVANVSLALNYALAPRDVRDVFVPDGTGPRAGTREAFLGNVWGYHLLNLLTHLAAGLLLFGCLRRTLGSERLAPTFGSAATWLAFTATLIWLVHPLQTESVTYVVQRVESLMGLFYLLTLYCAIRAWEETSARLWSAGAVVACALGMGTKEAMVTAPLVIALWDWTFAPRGRRPRWGLLAGLCATWLVLGVLVWQEHRAPSLDLQQATAARYLLTQAAVILHYLRLAAVPSPLVILYTWPLASSFTSVAVPVAVVAVLVTLTIVGIVRRVPLAFAGAWFFLVLAPTSSVLPIVTEVAAEHRMYLPLAAVVVCVVLAMFLGARWLLAATGRGSSHARYAGVAAAVAVAAAASALGAQTSARNRDYWSDEALWQDAVAKQPDNERARVLYGVALMSARHFADAESQLREAVRLAPGDAVPLARLGAALASQGKVDEAVAAWESAVALAPTDYPSRFYLGEAYAQRQQDRKALDHFERVLEVHADDPILLLHVATILADSSDAALRNPARAIELARRAVQLTGRQNAQALDVLAVAQAAAGRFREAAATASEALQIARQQGNRRLVAELERRAAAYQSR